MTSYLFALIYSTKDETEGVKNPDKKKSATLTSDSIDNRLSIVYIFQNFILLTKMGSHCKAVSKILSGVDNQQWLSFFII